MAISNIDEICKLHQKREIFRAMKLATHNWPKYRFHRPTDRHRNVSECVCVRAGFAGSCSQVFRKQWSIFGRKLRHWSNWVRSLSVVYNNFSCQLYSQKQIEFVKINFDVFFFFKKSDFKHLPVYSNIKSLLWSPFCTDFFSRANKSTLPYY